MRAFLTGQHGNLAIPAGSNILGRGQDCALRIEDPRLSRHHARLLFDGSELIIEDLGSTNGVLVNGERIDKKRTLRPQDTVVCGPCVFTVVLDPTQKASASELMPATDRRPDPHETEAMDPLNLPGTDKVPVGKPGRQLNPMIAAALSSSGVLPTDVASDVSSDVLKPIEQPKVHTDVLIHHTDTTPRGNLIALPTADERERREKTTGLVPADFKPAESAALQPDFVAGTRGGKAVAWRRGVAGAADLVSLLLVTASTGLPVLIAGYTWALLQAGAIVENGLPQLTTIPGTGAGGIELAKSLLHDSGVVRAYDIAGRLMRAADQQPFLTLFATASLALLVAVVCAILYFIGSTVVHGAPFWHRRLGLEIVEHRTGYLLTWTRAVMRWLCFLLLWPLAPIALGLDKRSLHDVLSGCAVRSKRG
jgi:pSer/pThr/pTyr-binding forkhead associated (FHA) protein